MRLALSLALAALLALASTAPARAQEADEPEEGGLTVLAPSEVPVERPVEAWIRAEPAEVEVGQPMRWHVEVHHPADLRPTVAEEPRVHDSWYLLSFDGARTSAHPTRPDLQVTTASWEAVSLAPGERRLPSLALGYGRQAVELGFASQEEEEPPPTGGGLGEDEEPEPEVELRSIVRWHRGLVAVQGVLGKRELEPRPSRGLRPLGEEEPEEEGSARRAAVLGGVIGATASALIVTWILRRRRGPSAPPEPTPLERLAAWKPEADADPEALRALHYELTKLVRLSLDRHRGVSHEGRTDEEWLEEACAGLSLGAQEQELLASIFAHSAAVKYGGEHPTTWAVEETLEAARRVLASVEAPGVSQGGASRQRNGGHAA